MESLELTHTPPTWTSSGRSADMSVSVLIRLLEAAGYDLKLIKAGHQRTIEDILDEQRSSSA